MIFNANGIPEIKDLPTLFQLLPNSKIIKSVRSFLKFQPENSYFPKFSQFSGANVYNVNDAWVLAEASNLAYEENKNVISNELSKIQFKLIELIHDEKLDGDCFLAEKDDILWVIFRGTEPTDFKDWYTDLKGMTKYIGRARVHTGFHNSAQALLAKKINGVTLFDYLKEADTKKRRIYFSGHSLGGALATYTAWYMTKSYDDNGSLRKSFIDRNKVLVYTYGAPNVGNSAFASEMQGLIYRFAHNQDIVARIPNILEYTPAGVLYFISPDGQITKPEKLTDISIDTLGNMATQMESLLNMSFFFHLEKSIQVLRPLLDHSLTYYCAHLRNAKDKV